ncbi:MAG TPA: nucleotidyl transferase AbiEii/AbiGii toxin family protein [Saprospiraceae bacterium]|nr:nucleotidyl transferase AbiEii/AbiGii toxin family protein [Saprospiraceae bacterium]HPG08344.1 nucleotidyl transferase AbiEii/AbiGii toxin family protein [Saprospiraceae bacterium]HRV85599.1 nucleotidyl transferase AbiEii/AbiGii toxin family protein [Saprospiraceae bacterium]
MIKPGEIQNKARVVGVRDQQIEKDYILSWILQGIAQHEHLSKTLVFKGGTVLKKVYFEDYRISEDLDFTLLNNEISNDKIFKWFAEVFEYVLEEANISLEIIDNNEHEDGGINFYISYIGPLGGSGANKKVKADISRSETLVFEPIKHKVFLEYTDQEDHELLCYPLEEVLVEKMRSVMQRMQARDFYDIWYLLEIHGMDVEFCVAEFRTKCESKGIDPAEFHNKLEQRLPQYEGRWQSSMADQIKDLPDFGTVERQVMRHFNKIELK